MNLVSCNTVQQYLLFAKLAERFAQPSITPPHIQYVILSVPRLCMELQDRLSCNYCSAKLAAGAKKQVAGKIRGRVAWFTTSARWTLYHQQHHPLGAGREKDSWPEQTLDPVPRSNTLHRSTSSLATTKGITVMLSLPV